uniref:Uncharacterized protein n=1 Tax=Arundo donax TaxID=35708 RepID=A0A0A9EQ96_ARUDO
MRCAGVSGVGQGWPDFVRAA